MPEMNEVEQLEEYTKLDLSEIQEVCDMLIELKRCSDYMTDDFSVAIDKQISWQLRRYKDDFNIVEKEATPQPVKKYKTLEYKG